MLEIDIEFKDGAFKNVSTGEPFHVDAIIAEHLKISEGSRLSVRIWWSDKQLTLKIVPRDFFISYRQLELHALKMIRKEEYAHLRNTIKEIFIHSDGFESLMKNLRVRSDGNVLFAYLIELALYYSNGGEKISYISTYNRKIDIEKDLEELRKIKKGDGGS